MAKKADKVAKDLAKELKKLRKENEKLAKSLEKVREDQAESRKEIMALLEERLVVPGTDEAQDHTHDENGGFVTAESTDDGDVPEASAVAQQEVQEELEITDAAKRRAKELGVDPAQVKGTGSGGRVLVKDVEAVAGEKG